MFYFSHLPRIYSKLKHLKASYITRDDRDSVYHDIFSLGRYVRFQISQKCFVIHKLRADLLQRPPWPPKNDRQSPSPSVPSCGRKTLQLPVVKYEGPWFLQGLHCQLDVRLILPGNGHMESNGYQKMMGFGNMYLQLQALCRHFGVSIHVKCWGCTLP